MVADLKVIIAFFAVVTGAASGEWNQPLLCMRQLPLDKGAAWTFQISISTPNAIATRPTSFKPNLRTKKSKVGVPSLHACKWGRRFVLPLQLPGGETLQCLYGLV
ncbi:hypothetical protein BV22DRAFT_1033206 [Leucogyrophana mollusca]|uniref:Uncharacterized protein n=1 Tax=Leucogyrophana mollusca TaxID=85980 RepID=A0ACB8BJR1_9AGAM|nr:hypothetical protein BV22DRAFT_1033206 [Leucogyrophana mollusca]